MRVFLIHGMGRSPRSLLPFSRALQDAGHAPLLFGYRVRSASFDAIGQAFLAFVRRTMASEPAAPSPPPYAIVGHSLGNVITRHISPALPPGWTRFVMLAPPNQPANLAQKLRHQFVFRHLTGSAGQALGDADFYARLPVPPVATLVFAGALGGWGRLLPRQDTASDGVVSVAETRLAGAFHRVVPALHTFIMDHPTVRSETLRFLQAEDPAKFR